MCSYDDGQECGIWYGGVLVEAIIAVKVRPFVIGVEN
jgi:hypothetical protein